MKRWLLVGGIVLVLGGAGGAFFVLTRPTGGLPKSVTKQATFTLYYPSELPSGYALVKESARTENDIVFYALASGNKQVRISEQIVPAQPPDLASIPGFKKLDTVAGNAAIGKNAGAPTALLLTNTTLITIGGSSSVPQDVIVRIAQQMTSLAGN